MELLLGQQYIYDIWGEPPSSTDGWTTRNGTTSSSYTSTCYGQTIIGGYNVFGTGGWAWKEYSGLKGHSTVSIQFDMYFIDSWDGSSQNDSISLDVDGVNRAYTHYSYGSMSSTNYCGGSSYSDYITQITIGPFPHNSTTIKLSFTTGLNQDPTDESFGFKNVKITVHVICTPACATCFGNDITECNSCNSGWFLYGTTCMNPCPTSFYGDSGSRKCLRKLFSRNYIVNQLFSISLQLELSYMQRRVSLGLFKLPSINLFEFASKRTMYEHLSNRILPR